MLYKMLVILDQDTFNLFGRDWLLLSTCSAETDCCSSPETSKRSLWTGSIEVSMCRGFIRLLSLNRRLDANLVDITLLPTNVEPSRGSI